MLNINKIRNHFPSLKIKNSKGDKIIYLDGPGGTQVPNSVINAISNYYITSNSNTRGSFITSNRTDKIMDETRKNLSIFLGAQNSSKYISGAYTGEISSKMLRENYCQFSIIGHSERRTFFNQNNQDIKLSAENLINEGINPIICVGESLEQKDAGITKKIIIPILRIFSAK